MFSILNTSAFYRQIEWTVFVVSHVTSHAARSADNVGDRFRFRFRFSGEKKYFFFANHLLRELQTTSELY